jgi:hypothetical protein
MSFGTELELAREKIRIAENAVETYLCSGRYDPEEHRRVLESAHSAREEFIKKLSELCPQ